MLLLVALQPSASFTLDLFVRRCNLLQLNVSMRSQRHPHHAFRWNCASFSTGVFNFIDASHLHRLAVVVRLGSSSPATATHPIGYSARILLCTTPLRFSAGIVHFLPSPSLRFSPVASGTLSKFSLRFFGVPCMSMITLQVYHVFLI